jgi:hypothetical protein
LGTILIFGMGVLVPIHAQNLNLEILSYSVISGSYSALDSQGDYAFAATGYGFKTYDITNPVSPVEIAHIPTEGLCKGISVEGNHLFVCDVGGGLLAYDITDIYNPALTDQLDIEGTIRSACPYGDYLYVTAEDYGLQIVDWSDPYNLSLIDVIYCGGEALKAVTLDNWLYVTIGTAGMAVYDITEPTSPVFEFCWNTTGGLAGELYLFPSGETLAMADFENGVYILDLTFPWIPTYVDSIAMSPYFAISVTGSESWAACSFINQGLQSFNALGTELDYLDIGDKCGPIHAAGDFVYLCLEDSALCIVDCQTPSNMSIASTLFNLGTTSQVCVVNDIAYIANFIGGLTVVDISDPTNPDLIQSTEPGWARDVLVIPGNEYLYVADFYNGLEVFALTDPLHPVLLNTVPTYPDSGAHSFEYRDGYLYMAMYDYGLNVYDLADPANPVMTHYDPETTFYYRELALTEDGQHIFACAEESGILAYTIYAPDSIVHEYTLEYLEQPFDITINGNYAYIADWQQGLNVLDITNYAYVFPVDSLLVQDAASAVALIDNEHLALSDWTEGVALVDITDPTNISEIGRLQTPSYAFNAKSDGSYLYLCDFYDFMVVDLYSLGIETGERTASIPTDDVRFHPAYPNPFNASSMLTFDVRNPGRIKIKVYNITGEEVLTLLDSNCGLGEHRVTFIADNLASGIYLATLETGKTKLSQKLLLIK